MGQWGTADELQLLDRLRVSLLPRAESGEEGARRALQAVEDLIAERESSLSGPGERDVSELGR
jgi:hypothetical protein